MVVALVADYRIVDILLYCYIYVLITIYYFQQSV